MTFIAEMSDGNVFEIEADDVRSAFAKAQKAYGIGRFVKMVRSNETGDVVYTEGEFVDISEAKKKILEEMPHGQVRLKTLRIKSLGEYHDFVCRGRSFSSMTKKIDQTTFKVSIYDRLDRNTPLKRYKITINIEADDPVRHKFANRVCIHCGKGLFDVDDPTGFCDG